MTEDELIAAAFGEHAELRSAPAEGGDPTAHKPDNATAGVSVGPAVTGDRASDQHASGPAAGEALDAARKWLRHAANSTLSSTTRASRIYLRGGLIELEQSLAALIESQRRDATRRALEMAAEIAEEHQQKAKAMQAGLLEKRDPFYGVGSADSVEWDKHQRAAGMAAAIAEAIRCVYRKPIRALQGTGQGLERE